jgi:hypothetical protein
MKQLKSLEETIKDIEMDIKKNPDPFLLTTLQRLKIYRDYELDRLVKKTGKCFIRERI